MHLQREGKNITDKLGGRFMNLVYHFLFFLLTKLQNIDEAEKVTGPVCLSSCTNDLIVVGEEQDTGSVVNVLSSNAAVNRGGGWLFALWVVEGDDSQHLPGDG